MQRWNRTQVIYLTWPKYCKILNQTRYKMSIKSRSGQQQLSKNPLCPVFTTHVYGLYVIDSITRRPCYLLLTRAEYAKWTMDINILPDVIRLISLWNPIKNNRHMSKPKHIAGSIIEKWYYICLSGILLIFIVIY